MSTHFPQEALDGGMTDDSTSGLDTNDSFHRRLAAVSSDDSSFGDDYLNKLANQSARKAKRCPLHPHPLPALGLQGIACQPPPGAGLPRQSL
eukprot:gene549-2462_t